MSLRSTSSRALACALVSLAVAAGPAHADEAPAWPDLAEDAGVQGGGEQDAAVVVGVGDYIYLPKISGAVDNAVAWQQWLLRSRKLRPERVVLLADKDATKTKIEKNLQAQAAQVGPQGTLWFVFIGHGAPAPTGDDGLLLGVDTDADADSVADRGLPQRRVLSLVGAGRQGKSVVVFDACFSGKTGDGSRPLVEGLQATIPVRKASTSSTTILAASDSFAGPIPGAGRPAFSYLLLGALRGWADDNGDRAIDVDEAYSFARGTIQALFKGADRLPSKSGPPVVLAKNAREEKPDLAALVSGRCSPNSRWDGRRCKELPKVKCPAGTSWNGSACASECPAGTRWDGDGCASWTIECPAGTSWNGSACVGGCPDGTRWNGSACEGERVASLPVTAGQGTRAGDQRREPKTGATWVWMPPGRFNYGCEPQDGACENNEKPGRTERVDGFWMMQTEVTDDAYRACERAGACSSRECFGVSLGSGREPAVCVDHGQAQRLCAWLGGRLPSAIEWEYAAKSGASRVYPWGDAAPNAARANCSGGTTPQAWNCGDPYESLAPVGSFPSGDSPWGLKDMAGNVYEWTSSNFRGDWIEIRGGGWFSNLPYLRAGYRQLKKPDYGSDHVGFRCVK
jgi:formylglycine-generating enzyme required for sulfatase activity